MSGTTAVRRILLIGTGAVLVSSLAACQLRAPAGRYEKDGIAFDHLAGWSVVRDTQQRARTIVVEGPQHAVRLPTKIAALLTRAFRGFSILSLLTAE